MADSFPRRSARTQRFTLGAPRNFSVSKDGARVAFLRSMGPEDAVNRLWTLDVASGRERLVADPDELLDQADADDLPPEERARRERAREGAGGIVAYDVDDNLTTAVFALAGRLFLADLVGDGATRTLDAAPGAFDPRLDPTGRRVAYVAGPTLRVTGPDGDRKLVGEDDPDVSWGSAEFVAGEEMGRTRGHWWSPDGNRILVERVDVSDVETWWLSSPAYPTAPPSTMRYPAAGSANATVDLAVIGLDGSRADVEWTCGTDDTEFEYLAEASWRSDAEVTLTVQTRDQRTLAVLAADPSSGATTELHRQTDPDWVELVPGVPAWAGDRLVSVSDHDGARRLLVDGVAVTPDDTQVLSVVDVGESEALVIGATEPTERQIFRVGFDATITPLTVGAGVHGAAGNTTTTVLTHASLEHDGSHASVVDSTGNSHTIVSHAAHPDLAPNLTMLRLGPNQLRGALLLPHDHETGRALPVLLDPYGGPHAQRVLASGNGFAASQWFADQGFAVLVVDGRGTPGRGPEWERAVAGDLAGPALEDQVDALAAAADQYPDLDLGRVAIRGWSFGGYLAALAVLRRPDVFHSAIAGAPVTDWRLYDTHYTERYLGHPDTVPAHYDRADLTADAPALRRPLLLIHGLADDNVVAAHTLRLSQALLEAGRPHEVLPLSGVSHMTPQEVVAENLLLLQVDFLERTLQ